MNLLFADDNEAVRNTTGDFLESRKYDYDNGDGKELPVFIDRSEKEPGWCHLYKANLHVTKDIFIPGELEDAVKEEDEITLTVMKFNKISSFILKGKNSFIILEKSRVQCYITFFIISRRTGRSS